MSIPNQTSEKRHGEPMPSMYVRTINPSGLFGSVQKAKRNKVSENYMKEHEGEKSQEDILQLQKSNNDQSMSVTLFDAAFGTNLNTKNSRPGCTRSFITGFGGDETNFVQTNTFKANLSQADHAVLQTRSRFGDMPQNIQLKGGTFGEASERYVIHIPIADSAKHMRSGSRNNELTAQSP